MYFDNLENNSQHLVAPAVWTTCIFRTKCEMPLQKTSLGYCCNQCWDRVLHFTVWCENVLCGLSRQNPAGTWHGCTGEIPDISHIWKSRAPSCQPVLGTEILHCEILASCTWCPRKTRVAPGLNVGCGVGTLVSLQWTQNFMVRLLVVYSYAVDGMIERHTCRCQTGHLQCTWC